MSTSDEGPTTITRAGMTCAFCKYHKQHMQLSGPNPVYHHYCEHPLSRPSTRLMAMLEPNGRFIGRSDDTPRWCPFITPSPTSGVG